MKKSRTRDQETITKIVDSLTVYNLHTIIIKINNDKQQISYSVVCLKLSVNYVTMQKIVDAACYACAQLGGTC